jgi:short-subunit dehydrogenase
MKYDKALITGATSGIGAAFAFALPHETNLVLCGRDERRLVSMCDGLRSDSRAVDWVVADLAKNLGHTMLDPDIDLLICNAGLGYYERFDRQREHEIRDTIEVNVSALTSMLLGSIPKMLKQAKLHDRRAGVIVVSSTAAFGPAPHLAVYAATKAYATSLIETLAYELADEPIDILCLCPGVTDTAFFEKAGMPRPKNMATAKDVALEGLDALGKRTIHICGTKNEHVQRTARTLYRNPMLGRFRKAFREFVGVG